MQLNNIACSMQTIFLDELGKNFIEYLDEDYLKQCYPVRSVLDYGILTALSSDAPVVKNFNPLNGITSALTRKTKEGVPIAEKEAITVNEAFKAYTVSAAKIGGNARFGSLQKGQLADFILLDENPLNTAVAKINDINVVSVYIDGKQVWQQAV